MTMFNYAQSNSLLQQEVDEKEDKGSHPNRTAAEESVVSPADTGTAAATPMSEKPKSISTSNAKEKIIPAKKSQRTKHQMANDATTEDIVDTVSQQKGSEKKSVPQDPQSNNDASANPSSTKNITEKKTKKTRIRKPRRIIPDKKEFIPVNEQPTQADIVGGRGGRSNHHPGNRPYWIRILESRLEYTKSRSDHEKARIANGILKYVKQELKGRFLNIDSKTKRWYILPDAVVLDKIKQALRDKYIPYWARELKIENKKRSEGNSSSAAKDASQGALGQLLGGMTTKQNLTALHPMSAFGSSLGVQSPNIMDQAVQLAAIKASRANATNSFGLPGTAVANVGAHAGFPSNPTAPKNGGNKSTKDGNKLGFLLGASAKRPQGPTAAIPTVDDILKCKVDQMPSFGGMPNGGLMAAMTGVSAPRIPSIGMNPFQSPFPPTLMNSLGFGGLQGPNALLNEAAHRGFGAGGNPGAPALPANAYGMGANLPPSIGVLQGINMKSLDKYMEEKMTGQSLGTAAFGPNAANLASLNMMSALEGTSFDSSTTHSPIPVAAPPAAKAPSKGPKKTDWNAMYAKALTKSK